VSNPSSEGIGPVKALTSEIQKIIQANQNIFAAQVNTVEGKERDLPKSRRVNSVSNPSSEGIGPVKAFSSTKQKIVPAGKCIFVAQLKVELQEGLTEVKLGQLCERYKLGRYRTCQGVII
jgi:hypothetical protein